MPYKDLDKQKQAQRESYLRTKSNDRRKIDRERRRKEINDLKEESPCMDCGLFWPYYVMSYDHRNSNEKVASVSLLIRMSSMDAVYNEIEKCDLVCLNCHGVRTHNRKFPS